jgi:ribonuclease HII
LLRFERQCWSDGCRRLAGLDEAGRGPLAGPVVAAAVMIQRSALEAEEHGLWDGLTDSKMLSAARREHYFRLLEESDGVDIGVGVADHIEIDAINILRATHAAMARAVLNLPSLPDHVLVDGLAVKGLPCSSTAIVRGDARSLLIAAASVVAKVVRDRCMRQFDRLYPQFGFAGHKGYGSRAHMQALLEHGPCPIHRQTFRPVREAAEIRRRAAETP